MRACKDEYLKDNVRVREKRYEWWSDMRRGRWRGREDGGREEEKES